MLVTRETDYAIRTLRSLSRGGKKTLAQICVEEFVPQQFGYKILKKLSRAGFVTIKRGKDGGYTIADDFGKRTLYELTSVMENPTDISPCVNPDYRCEAHKVKEESCSVNRKLSTLQHVLDSALKDTYLLAMFQEDW